jgi:poly(3-hydroxybutyrate) depolymerase
MTYRSVPFRSCQLQKWRQYAAIALLSAGLTGCSPQGSETLPKLGIDIDKTSTSGLSAGAYMAGQLQVAHSNRIIGAGIVAGGPYGCAEAGTDSVIPVSAANVIRALEGCMSDKLRSQGIPNVDTLVERATKLASEQRNDALEGLAEDKIYLFTGGADRIVAPSVVEAARDFYLRAGVPESNIKLETRNDAGHAFLTEDTGTACGASAPPFLSDCDYDQAGAILDWIYGDLAAPSAKPAGKFVRFDQTEFVKGDADMSKEGVVYIPNACTEEAGCRLHIALHGCEQNLGTVGTKFVEGSGFARWADTNRMVVLFPQVSASLIKNPKGCWDWWGYTGGDYLTKKAPQIAAIWSMVDRLAMNLSRTATLSR